MLRGRNGGRNKKTKKRPPEPCGAREATRLSFRFAELSNCLWQVEEKKKGGGLPRTLPFFLWPFADDVCRSTTLENRRLFSRSFPWIQHTHSASTSFLPTSGFRARKFRNLFGALFLFFFSFSYFLSKFGKSFWFKRYDSRIIGCRLKSLLNQKHGKRRYVPRYEQRFILHILHIFPRLEQLAIHSWHVMQQRWASLSWNATCPGAVNEPREGCGWLGLRMEKK